MLAKNLGLIFAHVLYAMYYIVHASSVLLNQPGRSGFCSYVLPATSNFIRKFAKCLQVKLEPMKKNTQHKNIVKLYFLANTSSNRPATVMEE